MSLLKKITSWKYFKDTLIVVGVAIVGLVAVMGTHWSDTSNRSFWWKFWAVAGAACIVLWLALWVVAKFFNDREE